MTTLVIKGMITIMLNNNTNDSKKIRIIKG